MSVRNRGDSEEDWDMLEDVASVDRTSKEPDSTTDDTVLESDITDNQNRYEDEEYDDEDYGDENDREEIPVEISPIEPSRLGLKFSYKDAILANKHPKRTVNTQVPSANKRQQRVWKPIIQVEKIIMKPSVTAMPVNNEPDDDESGFNELIYQYLDGKQTTAASRYRSITRLTPSQQYTKDARILQKKASK